jgi:lipid II:glycine glycyltransferase (peptidoglycan interpeptide bridge formation enzyme)
MISNKEAFAVLGDLDDELVTAALFPYSPKYCYYGVSASKRDLFSKPLSHVVMWKAIKNAKDLGCRFFELGPQYYPKQHPGATKKDFSISTFKHGFGGSTHVRLNIVWES